MEVPKNHQLSCDKVELTWAFLGFSTWFSILLGFLELVPGFLLLFKRTKFLGAILLFPSLLGVFLVNNAYNFMSHMIIFTGFLLFFGFVVTIF